MSEKIERVAQAICGDDNPANILAIHRFRARAAIEAMREPTQLMLNAGAEAFAHHTNEQETANLWRAMIDAAMKP